MRTIRRSAGFQPPWKVQQLPLAPSTNLVAARLPAWHAVRADTQTAGRGRFQRTWVSDAGGLWLSAVLPIPTWQGAVRLLPLVAGLAVCDALRGLGLRQLHMRWPNDVLVHERKLAGLLIDQFAAGLAVVGIGINVRNRPENADPSLSGQVARLAELVPAPPSLEELMHTILSALRSTWTRFEETPESLLAPINALWQCPRLVQLDLDGQVLTGQFEGVDATGRLQLSVTGSETRFFEPHEVRLLREIP